SLGTASAWNPDFNLRLRDIREVNGSKVYAVGDFTSVGSGSFTRQYIAAVHPDSAAVFAWAPESDSPLTVLYQFNPIVVGGGMTNIGNSGQEGVAAVVESDGTLA